LLQIFAHFLQLLGEILVSAPVSQEVPTATTPTKTKIETFYSLTIYKPFTKKTEYETFCNKH